MAGFTRRMGLASAMLIAGGAAGCSDGRRPDTSDMAFGTEDDGEAEPCEPGWNGICLGEPHSAVLGTPVQAPMLVEDLDRDGDEEVVFADGRTLDLSRWPELAWRESPFVAGERAVATVQLGPNEPMGLLGLSDAGALRLARPVDGAWNLQTIDVVSVPSDEPWSFITAADLNGQLGAGVDELLVLEGETLRIWTGLDDVLSATTVELEGCGGGIARCRYDDDDWDDLVVGCEHYTVFRSSSNASLEIAFESEFKTGNEELAPIASSRRFQSNVNFVPMMFETHLLFVNRTTRALDPPSGFGASKFGAYGWNTWVEQPTFFSSPSETGLVDANCPVRACNLNVTDLDGVPALVDAAEASLLLLLSDSGNLLEAREVTYHFSDQPSE